ncbi:unnamed protein product [Prunus armeniaca]|uniref:NAD-dependent epimerase/dehydratase domain-containing protein n=1 Tax=Prunus armeniaca TaxID=36596 RepID=A0A6J5Y8X8_PRUAR|nr:unnamed protein product [Prunus armeniaca]
MMDMASWFQIKHIAIRLSVTKIGIQSSSFFVSLPTQKKKSRKQLVLSQRVSFATMELCRATAFSWTHRVSTSLHVSLPLSKFETKRLSVWCASDRTQKANAMTVSITGATGFIGRRLVQRLHADNHSVHVLTRSKSKAELIFPVKEFPGIVIAEEPEWKDSIRGSNGVVNLAGVPISTRWSPEIKKEIKDSRIRVTSKVIDLINDLPDSVRPTVLVSATAVGYYGTSETQVFDEQSPSGNDTWLRLRQQQSQKPRCRSHLLRDGIVIVLLLEKKGEGEK